MIDKAAYAHNPVGSAMSGFPRISIIRRASPAELRTQNSEPRILFYLCDY